MRQLENLPVWVVVRLCTDEDKMVNYWNNVDSEVELNMDVIDDMTLAESIYMAMLAKGDVKSLQKLNLSIEDEKKKLS